MNPDFPEVIIFDLDDTIIEFYKGVVPSWKTACSLFCKNNTYVDKDSLYTAIRIAGQWYWKDPERHRIGRNDLRKARREIVVIAFHQLGLSNNADAFGLADHYSDLRMESLTLFPSAKETLNTFKEKKQRMVLLTNGESSLQREKIKMFDLEHYFEKIFIEGEVGIGKPDIRAYQNLLDCMKLKPRNVWMVGDNLEWDVYAPQSIGIYSIWNDFGQQGLPDTHPSVPDRIISNISELLG
ncbi:MAG: HAD family hydrolase [Spirochaetales bacterium]|nr:HAD family hydrolase [Spirochaetales bacterium]